MTSPRRVAREFALKALFQADVGKQPLPDVLAGALEQIVVGVRNPIAQVLREAQAALRAEASRLSAGASAQTARRYGALARAAGRIVAAVAQTAAEQAADVTAPQARTTEQAALARTAAALGQALIALQPLAARGPLGPGSADTIVTTASQWARHLEQRCRKHLPGAAQAASFARSLIVGAYERRNEIDARIASLATGWTMDRQAAVDRNILRLAAYEILYVPDVPASVSINEAIELAKKYSTAESGRFVNGVLGALVGGGTRGEARAVGDPPQPSGEATPMEGGDAP